ncbi:MAG: nuclear transport factor 2 family protein [Pseudomonadota bacterium]
MNSNEQLIQRFYSAFQKKDHAGMAACYHKDVVFSDPVFIGLKGDRARGMWKMLCISGADLRLEYDKVMADEEVGSAHWDAWYTFSKTGRKVLNRIDATFQFRDGLIYRHNDNFDLHAWAGQALGLPGKLLGGTGFMQGKIRAMAGKSLDDFLKS